MSQLSMFGSNSKFIQFTEWITRMLHLQLVWTIFLIIGLGVSGFFPASFAMFAIVRKWIKGEEDFSVNKAFLNFYKAHFIKANLIGYGYILTGVSFLYYFHLIDMQSGIFFIVLKFLLLTVLLLYVMTGLFFIPVYVHFDIDVLEMVRHAFIIAITHPFHIALMIGVFIAFGAFLNVLPILLPFIAISMLVYFLMRIAVKAFQAIEGKQQEQQSS
ncbi:YesL family protein [Gracilibacillus alcaliphilus]|uniref:YesL family protein n=1 Tax=Gracilibacillus alcaliphilus TaxID=1401441 RepID=UPI00195EDCEF|nr:DUF624 domain-containing protein [Gracilibacillus alcaliphilus]MBM7677117.1 putative membrane protein YesL [Gracilibacillus alcaliphilus]